MFLTEESTTGAVRKGLEPDETDLKEQEEVGLGYTTLTSHVLFRECAGKQNATVQTFQNTHNYRWHTRSLHERHVNLALQ